MPVSLQFTATAPAGITSWTLAPSPPPSLGAFVPCDSQALDQAALLGVLDRSYPYDYIQGLKLTQNSGYEQFYGAAKVGERVSLGVANFECDSFVISANGGRKAVGNIEIWKTDPVAFTLKRGSTFSTSDGRVFVSTVDQDFDSMNLGPFLVPIEAIEVGYVYNVPGEVVARNGEVLPGAITQIGELVISPAAFDPTIQIRQVLPTYGGREAALDALAADLLIPRLFGEEDPEYRLRIKETPDTVSPNAVIRGVNRLLRARDPSWSCILREIGYPLFPGIFYDAGSSTDSPQNPDMNFAWDMDPNYNVSNLYKVFVSIVDSRAFFIVEVPVVNDVRDFGLVYDVDGSATYPQINAYDTTAIDAHQAAYDGQSLYSFAFYQSIIDLVERKRAGGVGYAIVKTFTPNPPPPPV
jgi:hypothetical protein